MSSAVELAKIVVDFLTMLKPGDYEWQQRKIKEIYEIKKLQKTLEATLQKELDLLKIKFEEEIKREKEKQTRITANYKEFLNSLDDMKEQLKITYKKLPPPMILIIYNHARELLDGTWRESDDRAREICKKKLAEFMLVVYEDAEQELLEGASSPFPTKTIELIRGETES